MPPTHRTDPLPLDAIRDLLGLVRGLYRAERVGNAEPYRLAKLAAIGIALQRALELAADQPDVGSIEHREAWREAEQACQDLPGALPMASPMQSVVNASRSAVLKRAR